MADDDSLPPVLDGAIYIKFVPRQAWDTAKTGCGACHRGWDEHGLQRLDDRGIPEEFEVCCARCGIPFSDACYWRLVTSPAECEAFWAEGGEVGYIFLCAGCRS
jgi:hypothetical protein